MRRDVGTVHEVHMHVHVHVYARYEDMCIKH